MSKKNMLQENIDALLATATAPHPHLVEDKLTIAGTVNPRAVNIFMARPPWTWRMSHVHIVNLNHTDVFVNQMRFRNMEALVSRIPFRIWTAAAPWSLTYPTLHTNDGLLIELENISDRPFEFEIDLLGARAETEAEAKLRKDRATTLKRNKP
jgi:hypothetical protein